jgi:holin-like protein
MLVAITQLLCCQLVGEVFARVLDVSIPGPVIGMSLLLIVLLYKETIPQSLESTAEGILSLLFVPHHVVWIYESNDQSGETIS